MFLRKKMKEFTETYLDKVKIIKKEINSADAIVIGAGAGLSTSAGAKYDGNRFEKYFSDFRERYGFEDMYSGGFYPFESDEIYWAYWSRYININRYEDVDNGTYKNLYELVKDKNYFVITTNVDHMFQKAGFDKSRLFYTQGDYGLFQCSVPCCQKTFDNEDIVKKMVEQQKDMKIPSELVPICPNCGAKMTMNLRADDKFVEDEGWHKAKDRYVKFLENNLDKKILFLELGVGLNTPGIIKYPFWRMVKNGENAKYISISLDSTYIPEKIADRSMCINDDIGKVVTDIKK